MDPWVKDLALPQTWMQLGSCIAVAVDSAPIRTPAQELPYAAGVAIKKKKKKEKKKIIQTGICEKWTHRHRKKLVVIDGKRKGGGGN